MRTSTKVIAAVLSMIALQSNAIADDQIENTPNRALHLSIALQGDQALLDIQAEAKNLIADAIEHQMAMSLPRMSQTNHLSQSQQDAVDIDLAAISMNP